VTSRQASFRLEPETSRSDDGALGDLRFRNLLSQAEWAALPPPIRQRFSKRLAGGQSAVYVGQVLETRLTRIGTLFSQIARLIGGPLPVSTDAGLPAIVSVTENTRAGGQTWTRLYAHRGGLPQIIHTAKCFGGATGLEEYIGCGFGMALTVHVAGGALLFCSAGYFLRLGARRFTLPGWMTPGQLIVTHAEAGHGRFTFSLEILHPRFGMIVQQTAIFREATP
jgi:hypothetical protein